MYMSIDEMREALIDHPKYRYGRSWKQKVKRMPDKQVFAVYTRMESAGDFVKGIRKSDDAKIVHLSSLQPTPCNACGYCKAVADSTISTSDEDFENPLEAAKQSFESGHYAEETDFKSAEDYARYLEYMYLGPEGFYEEFKDALDFDEMFVEAYDYDE